MSGSSATPDAMAKKFTAAQRALKQAKKRLEEWARLWADALRLLALLGDTPPVAARETITLLNDLAASEKTAADLEHRIKSITADYDAFAAAISTLCAELAPDLQTADALGLIRKLNERLAAANMSATKRERLEDRKQIALHRISELEQELRDADGVLSRLCEQAQCGAAEDLPAIEEQATRRDALRDELAKLDKRIVEQGEQPVDELQQLLGERTGDELAAELAAHDDTPGLPRASSRRLWSSTPKP